MSDVRVMKEMMVNKNCLSYWFPKIEAAGLPVPKTKVLHMPSDIRGDMFAMFDGKPLPEAAAPFFNDLRAAAEEIGFPCFLRTGQTSGKHNWKNTCFLENSESSIVQHVLALIEYSECAGFLGLPWDVWCVREMLPTTPVMVADCYGDMPVCREFRYFVRDGKVICSHPYWPLEALIDGTDNCPPDIRRLYRAISRDPDDNFGLADNDKPSGLEALASAAGAAVGGDWSVDILYTSRGWYVTDMAVAQNSYHWENCPHASTLRESVNNTLGD